jgi:phenylacetate-coenzyme A ligase PaaK-like adenylate-forming protein
LPDLSASLLAGEPSVFVISDSPRDLRTSAAMPGLAGTFLRRLVLGRDPITDAAIIDYLRGARIALLHGKPSVLLQLAELDGSRPGARHIAPANIVCSGENLFPDDRLRLEASLGCPIVDAYATSEAGLVAFECGNRSGLHILADHLTVEVLRADGSIGETGSGELMLTNALNWRHAFIRYRIGDVATVAREHCMCGHDGQTIVSLPGRERSAYHHGNRVVPATDLAAVIRRAGPGVKQYQVQPGYGHRLTIRWIPDREVDVRNVASALATSLRESFPGVKFDVHRVKFINTPGGKLRRFL